MLNVKLFIINCYNKMGQIKSKSNTINFTQILDDIMTIILLYVKYNVLVSFRYINKFYNGIISQSSFKTLRYVTNPNAKDSIVHFKTIRHITDMRKLINSSDKSCMNITIRLDFNNYDHDLELLKEGFKYYHNPLIYRWQKFQFRRPIRIILHNNSLDTNVQKTNYNNDELYDILYGMIFHRILFQIFHIDDPNLHVISRRNPGTRVFFL
jgi:hypothetical protein